MSLRAAAFLTASLAVALLHALLVAPACAQQVTLSATRNLDFGRFIAGSGGAVTVDTSGARTRTGGVILLNSPGAGQAQFTVASNGAGGGKKSVVISLPANGAVRISNGAASMAVNAFVISPGTLQSIPAGGTTLSVGATLTVAAGQAPGTYTGSFPLIVNYQ